MEVSIRFQPTPNPNAGKFVLDREIVAGDRPRSYASRAEAADDPLAAALLDLEGVASVFMVEDFVTVTKEPAADWGELIPRVEEAIRSNV